MAIKRPDIYEHNNPLYSIADSDFVRGGFRTSVADLTALYALSTKVDQLKEQATVVYVVSESKRYVLVDINNVGNSGGWDEFVTSGNFLKLDQTIPENVTGSQPIFDEGIRLGATPSPSQISGHTTGRIYYDTTYETLSADIGSAVGHKVTLQIGQEALRYVHNNSGVNIPDGSVVYATGVYNGGGGPDVICVGLAIATGTTKSVVLGVATQVIENNEYGYVTVRGHINDLDTSSSSTPYSGMTVGDNLYLSDTILGGITNVAPISPSVEINIGRLITKDATVGKIYVNIFPAYSLNDLTNVTVSSPILDDVLKWNGNEWVNGPMSTTSASAGVNFYNGTPIIKSRNAPVGLSQDGTIGNGIQIATLAKIPVTSGGTQFATATSSNDTRTAVAWLYDIPIGKPIIDAGIWKFESYYSVNSVAGGRVPTITRQMYQVTPISGSTITISGASANSRIATITSNQFNGDYFSASTTNTIASWLQTPSGIYQISSKVSNNIVNIVVPTGYVNESGVSGSTWNKLFGITTPTLTTVLTLYEMNTIQPAFPINSSDKLGTIGFVTNVAGGSTTFTTTYNGTSQASYIISPLITMHNDLAGLQGGTSTERYHITLPELTVVQNTSNVNTGDETKLSIENKLTGTITTHTHYFSGITGAPDMNNYQTVLGFNSYTGTTAPIIAGAITGATNGLTKVGRDVKLGGIITTGVTEICGSDSMISELNFCNLFALRGCVSCYTNFDACNMTISGGQTCISGRDLTLNSTFGTNINIGISTCSCPAVINDRRYNKCGLEYGADYSAGFTARSLVDAAYVTGKTTTSGIQTATNGLTKSGTTVRLGGPLTGGNTIISIGANSINFDGNGTGGYFFVGGNNSVDVAEIYSNYFTLNSTCCATFGSNKAGCGGFLSTSTVGNIFSSCGATNCGLRYNDDYSSGFVARSLVDAAYVTGKTSTSGIQTASNGLTKIGSNVVLGGTLTGQTDIYSHPEGIYIYSPTAVSYIMIAPEDSFTGGFQVYLEDTGSTASSYLTVLPARSETRYDFDGTNYNLSLVDNSKTCFTNVYDGVTRKVIFGNGEALYYGGDYSSVFTARSIPDVGYVTGKTSTSGIQTANNGLTKQGTNVKLGGALTGDTALTGAYTLSVCGGAKLNTTCGYQISGVTILRTSPVTISSLYLGNNAGSNGTGINNFGIGCQTLQVVSTGTNNFGSGYQALYCNTTGCHNIALGYQSLYCNAKGNCNIGIGVCAMKNATGGTNNIGIGTGTLNCNKTGSNNLGFGYQVLYCNQLGCNNIAIGNSAMRNATGGTNNIGLGNNTLLRNRLGCSNMAIGIGAMQNSICGDNNIGIGERALDKNCGIGNIAIGICSLFSNISGDSNIALGNYTLAVNSIGLNNIGIGNLALNNNDTGCFNIAIGDSTLSYNTNVGNYNIGVGVNALYENTSGIKNIALGLSSLNKNINGCNNIGLGESSLYNNISGCYNVAYGNYSGYVNTTGCRNVFIGNNAGYNETSSNKLHIANCASCTLIYGDFVTNCVRLPYVNICNTPSLGSTSDSVLVRASDGTVKTVAGTALGDKNNIYSKTVVSTSTLLATGDTYVILVNHTTPITLTLPATPIDGEAFKIKDASTTGALTNNITIARNGNNIDRGANDAAINTDGGALELVYDASLTSWFTLAFVN